MADRPRRSPSFAREASRRPLGLVGRWVSRRRYGPMPTGSGPSPCECETPGLRASGASQPLGTSPWCRLRPSTPLMASRAHFHGLQNGLLSDGSPKRRPKRPPLRPLQLCLLPPTMTASSASPLLVLLPLLLLPHLRLRLLLRLLRSLPLLPLLPTVGRPRRREQLPSRERLRRRDVSTLAEPPLL